MIDCRIRPLRTLKSAGVADAGACAIAGVAAPRPKATLAPRRSRRFIARSVGDVWGAIQEGNPKRDPADAANCAFSTDRKGSISQLLGLEKRRLRPGQAVNRRVDPARERLAIASRQRALQFQAPRGRKRGNGQSECAAIFGELGLGDGLRVFIEMRGAVFLAAKQVPGFQRVVRDVLGGGPVERIAERDDDGAGSRAPGDGQMHRRRGAAEAVDASILDLVAGPYGHAAGI